MILIAKVVFRLDYPTCFEIMNRQGDVARIIHASSEEYWTDFRHSQRNFGFQGIHNSKDRSFWANVLVEQNAIHGSMEIASGEQPEVARDHTFLAIVDRVIAESLLNFQIAHIARAGLRFYVVGFGSGSAAPGELNLVSRDGLSELRQSLGSISDVGVTLEGKAKQGVSFRLTTGPAGPNDYKNFLKQVAADKIDTGGQTHRFSADLDFYEFDIELPNRSFRRWSATKWELLNDFMGNIEAKLY